MKPDGTDASPMKAVLEELDSLRVTLRETLACYSGRLENEINSVRETVQNELGNEKISHAKLRDLRDMLTLLRNTQIKTEKGRRKDLKKIDSIVGDLMLLIENW